MKAEDTVITLWDEHARIRDIILMQAEITWDIAHKAGIKEVLEWQRAHYVIGFGYDTDDPKVETQNMIDWANALKEWGV